MGQFLYHEACSKCGSSDARAVYEGGSSFCFSCRVATKGTVSPYLLERKKSFEVGRPLPDDVSYEYPEYVLNWVFKYGLSIPELIKHNVYYSKLWDQLIFSWYGDDTKTPVLWQGRNFRPDAKSKCFTSGEPDKVLPLYQRLEGNLGAVSAPLVIVEDPISAIKIARLTTSMPVLGSDLSPTKIKRIASLVEASAGAVVWLDGNMFHKAQKIAQRLELLGVEARAVYTELDPKCYDTETIVSIVKPSYRT